MLLVPPGNLHGAHNHTMPEMSFPNRTVISCLSLAAALALGGCVVAPAHNHRYESEEIIYGPTSSTYVLIAPPAPRVEYRGYPPVVGYIWIDGYWSWGGVSYAWVPGRWAAPRPGYIWVPHRWQRDGDRWRQNGGRWEQSGRSGYSYRERERDDDDRDHDRGHYPGTERMPAAQPRTSPPPRVQSPPPRAEPRQPDPRWPHGAPVEEQREPRRSAAPRPDMYTPSERSQRDPRDPHRRERQEEWRKDKDKDQDKERDRDN